MQEPYTNLKLGIAIGLLLDHFDYNLFFVLENVMVHTHGIDWRQQANYLTNEDVLRIIAKVLDSSPGEPACASKSSPETTAPTA